MMQVATALILILAANTSFADFPRLSSILARDRFLPRQLANLGDRLVFVNGIILLALLSGLLIYIFKASTHSLIPLYAVGVFVSFTLSQSGMVRKWWRERGRGWMHSIVFNLLGAAATSIVLVVVVLAKFKQGAWIVALLIPAIVLFMRGIWLHYRDVARQLTLEGARLPAAMLHHAPVDPGAALRQIPQQRRHSRDRGHRPTGDRGGAHEVGALGRGGPAESSGVALPLGAAAVPAVPGRPGVGGGLRPAAHRRPARVRALPLVALPAAQPERVHDESGAVLPPPAGDAGHRGQRCPLLPRRGECGGTTSPVVCGTDADRPRASRAGRLADRQRGRAHRRGGVASGAARGDLRTRRVGAAGPDGRPAVSAHALRLAVPGARLPKVHSKSGSRLHLRPADHPPAHLSGGHSLH